MGLPFAELAGLRSRREATGETLKFIPFHLFMAAPCAYCGNPLLYNGCVCRLEIKWENTGNQSIHIKSPFNFKILYKKLPLWFGVNVLYDMSTPEVFQLKMLFTLLHYPMRGSCFIDPLIFINCIQFHIHCLLCQNCVAYSIFLFYIFFSLQSPM